MSKTTRDVLTIIACAAVIVVALSLTGCASWNDYAGEVRAVNTQIAADRKADRDREAKEDQGIGAALANPALKPEERIAIAGFWAMTKMSRGGSMREGPGYMALTPPPDPWDGVVKLSAVLVPTIGQVAVAAQNASVQKVQSNNSVLLSQSTNAAFIALGGEAGSTARAAIGMIPSLRPNITLSGTGVIGSGAYSPTTTTTTTTLTTGGDGVIGGSLTRPASPSRVCTVDSTGALSCAP